jgi:hypothetical protein
MMCVSLVSFGDFDFEIDIRSLRQTRPSVERFFMHIHDEGMREFWDRGCLHPVN